MSDKLEKCVCGGDGFNYKYITGEKLHTVRCDDGDCICETPCYTTEIEAATAWNTMQRALIKGSVTWATAQLELGFKLTSQGWGEKDFIYLDKDTVRDETCKAFNFNGIMHCSDWMYYPDPPKD